MSNKISTDLFDLIQSLSKTEKRYFKVFSTRHTLGKINSYITLFNFIEKMKEYDEELIYKHFKGAFFLNKFSITKGRLYNYILRSLDSFYSQKSIESKIFRLMHSADILYKKTLYSQSLKLLNRALKLSKKHDKFTFTLEINLKKKNLLKNNLYSKEKEVEKNWIEEKEELKQIKQYFELWYIKNKYSFNLDKYTPIRSKEKRKELTNVIQNIRFDKNQKNYFCTEYLYYQIHSTYYYNIGNFDLSYRYTLKNINLFKSNEFKIKEKPNLYFSILTNGVFLASKLNDEKIDGLLYEIKIFNQKYNIKENENFEIKMFTNIKSIECLLYSHEKKFEKIIELEKEILNGYKKYTGKLSKNGKAYLNHSLSIAHFSVGNYKKSLRWNNKVLNETRLNKKTDILTFAYLVNLIIHFELGNYRLLSYSLKSVERFLKNRTNGYKIETFFLTHLNKMINAKNKIELIPKIDSLIKELNVFKNNPKEQMAFEYFDFISWLISKKQNKLIKDVLLNQAS